MSILTRYSLANRTGDMEWVVTLQLRGRRYRFGRVGRVITNSDSEQGPATLQVLSGLTDPEVSDSSDIGSMGDLEVSIEVTFYSDSSTHADAFASLVAQDGDLDDATAELALWLPGQDWEDRLVVVSGPVLEPVYGELGEPLAFGISSTQTASSSVLPPIEAQVRLATWPRTSMAGTHSLIDANRELWYPWVYGYPGERFSNDEFSGDYPATPGIIVEIDTATLNNAALAVTVLIAGHDTQATNGSVRIFNQTTGSSALVATSLISDKFNRPVTVCSFTSATLAVSSTSEIWVGWQTTAGGRWNRKRTGAMRGAGEVIFDMLSASGDVRDLDIQGFDAAIPLLDAFRFDFHINEPITDIPAFVQDVLMPLLPASLVRTERGRSLFVWQWQPETTDVVMEINPATRGTKRSSMVTTSSRKAVVNQRMIQFAPAGDTSGYKRHLTFAPSADSSDTTTQAHPLCRMSRDRYMQTLIGSTISADVVCDGATANAILSWMTVRDHATHQLVSYDVPIEYQSLRPGNVVAVTDDGIGWTNKLCHVLESPLGASASTLNLRTIPNLLREAPK